MPTPNSRTATNSSVFDQLVGGRQSRFRDGEPERLARGFKPERYRQSSALAPAQAGLFTLASSTEGSRRASKQRRFYILKCVHADDGVEAAVNSAGDHRHHATPGCPRETRHRQGPAEGLVVAADSRVRPLPEAPGKRRGWANVMSPRWMGRLGSGRAAGAGSCIPCPRSAAAGCRGVAAAFRTRLLQPGSRPPPAAGRCLLRPLAPAGPRRQGVSPRPAPRSRRQPCGPARPARRSAGPGRCGAPGR